MKKLLIAALALLSGYAQAEVADVNIWEPYPGRAADLRDAAQEARSISQKLGIEVYVGLDQRGNLHYGNTADSWETWAKQQAALAESADWQAFVTKYESDPSGKLVESFNIFSPMVAETKAVSVVFSWDVYPGKTDEFLTSAQEAAAIQTKLGASVGMHIDDLGDVHYEVTFDSWGAWARWDTAMANSEEWAAFWTAAGEDPTGELRTVYRVNVVQ